ncbi:UNVERIFIED_CONTAM: hypothetical protein HDU68_009503 [Siphonaria sp. JEL0065]|nr:hypothetical protein HDU68_009503 [Siphonaria sp. JEL0065]
MLLSTLLLFAASGSVSAQTSSAASTTSAAPVTTTSLPQNGDCLISVAVGNSLNVTCLINQNCANPKNSPCVTYDVPPAIVTTAAPAIVTTAAPATTAYPVTTTAAPTTTTVAQVLRRRNDRRALERRTTETVRIVSLSLKGQGLTGALPAGLGDLTSLVSLDLSGNKFTGDLPASFENLVHLKTLDLSGSSLSGPIFDDLLALLQANGGVVINQITPECLVLTAVFNYSSIAIGAFKQGDCSSVANNTYVTYALGPPVVHTTTIARTTTAAPAAQATTRVTTTVAPPTFLKKRDHRVARRDPNGERYQIVSLSVKNLHLGGSVPSGIGQLTHIESLDLSGNGFTGTFPDDLSNLKSLKYLNIDGNKFSTAIPDALLAIITGNGGKVFYGNTCIPGNPDPNNACPQGFLPEIDCFDLSRDKTFVDPKYDGAWKAWSRSAGQASIKNAVQGQSGNPVVHEFLYQEFLVYVSKVKWCLIHHPENSYYTYASVHPSPKAYKPHKPYKAWDKDHDGQRPSGKAKGSPEAVLDVVIKTKPKPNSKPFRVLERASSGAVTDAIVRTILYERVARARKLGSVCAAELYPYSQSLSDNGYATTNLGNNSELITWARALRDQQPHTRNLSVFAGVSYPDNSVCLVQPEGSNLLVLDFTKIGNSTQNVSTTSAATSIFTLPPSPIATTTAAQDIPTPPLSGGVIAGISLATVAACVGSIALILVFYKRREHHLQVKTRNSPVVVDNEIESSGSGGGAGALDSPTDRGFNGNTTEQPEISPARNNSEALLDPEDGGFLVAKSQDAPSDGDMPPSYAKSLKENSSITTSDSIEAKIPASPTTAVSSGSSDKIHIPNAYPVLQPHQPPSPIFKKFSTGSLGLLEEQSQSAIIMNAFAEKSFETSNSSDIEEGTVSFHHPTMSRGIKQQQQQQSLQSSDDKFGSLGRMSIKSFGSGCASVFDAVKTSEVEKKEKWADETVAVISAAASVEEQVHRVEIPEIVFNLSSLHQESVITATASKKQTVVVPREDTITPANVSTVIAILEAQEPGRLDRDSIVTVDSGEQVTPPVAGTPEQPPSPRANAVALRKTLTKNFSMSPKSTTNTAAEPIIGSSSIVFKANVRTASTTTVLESPDAKDVADIFRGALQDPYFSDDSEDECSVFNDLGDEVKDGERREVVTRRRFGTLKSEKRRRSGSRGSENSGGTDGTSGLSLYRLGLGGADELGAGGV